MSRTWIIEGKGITSGGPGSTGEDIILGLFYTIFNSIMGRPQTHPVKMDSTDRALHPKTVGSHPQDIIYCVIYFLLKEEIMAKACPLYQIDYQGAQIQLYQDLSWFTL